MRSLRIVFAGTASIYTIVAWAAPAAAGMDDTGIPMPAPGVLGLVAIGIGILGAIALARWRK